MTSRSLIEPWGSPYPECHGQRLCGVASPHAHNQSRAGKLFRWGRPGAKSISSLAAGVGFTDAEDGRPRAERDPRRRAAEGAQVPLGLQLLIARPHQATGDTKVHRELSRRGQPLADLQTSLSDRCSQRVLHLRAQRLRALAIELDEDVRGQTGPLNCHGTGPYTEPPAQTSVAFNQPLGHPNASHADHFPCYRDRSENALPAGMSCTPRSAPQPGSRPTGRPWSTPWSPT